MEKGTISGKKIGVMAAVLVLVIAAAVLLVIKFTGKENSYRSIQIYELKGTATIEREGIGSIDAVENLYLESGDCIRVASDSSMRLRLDEDKYIMVEENSVLTIVAEGTSQDSRTSINLEQGAITNEIQNRLNENSSYEVATPNSVMAVRGTVWRAAVSRDENRKVLTQVSIFEGRVGISLILPSGETKKETAVLEGGQKVDILMDNRTTEYLSEPKKIDYDELPVQCLEFLMDVMSNGTTLTGISPAEMEVLIGGQASGLSSTPSTQPSAQPAAQPTQSPAPSAVPSAQSPAPSTAESTQPPVQSTQSPAQPTGQPASGEDSAQQGSTDQPTEAPTAEPEGDEESSIYTVTFVYQGVVFGTQTVEEGQTITVPKLAPALSGAWDFDFSQPVTRDITVEWK